VKTKKSKTFKYFHVTLKKTAFGFFNLSVRRLMKKKEAKARGYAPMNQYRLCAEIVGMNERDAQCLVMALEAPRMPLEPNVEDNHWRKKLTECANA